MTWTDERIEQLRRLWEQGMTASQIAEELGGVSRNAVIGKAHRLGLQSRPSPVRSAETPVAAEAPAPAPAEPVEAPVAAKPAPAPVAPAVEEEEAEPAVATPVAPVTITEQPPIVTTLPPPPAPPQQMVRSIGPGGFQRQGPGDQHPPATPAPPRRLVPAKPSAEMAGKTSLLELNDKICKWPLGHPGEPDFHFCGQPNNPGFPYCLDHCSVAYQAQLPRRDRRPPPPLPFGGPRVR
ncbi:GcrA family cell cycle regulator [Sphingomonas solaris]|uniref:GcrA cell cycle regulator n=1 Tax=Alterirhizorhabdus solaris TaxID=2529389 RepID=A0A558R6M6_9SPHN|nr:GcrA family cell cycle regulator [Sphingomonas solaris]TVV75031.1 GcrA cell cycle regulator [Sphingomonas solaris]